MKRPQKSTFELADEATDGLMTTVREMMDKSLKDNIADFAKASPNVLDVYEVANMMRFIGHQTLLASTRLTMIAKNMKIEEVG
ncbi:hypothetical protein [Mesorhizobium sp. M7A.F.Ca.CA.004.02.1.1]|uniref:hypothetical protein n=1 Tax=Mesorhizobium sp. M7A.F.Ca.CA.004.02.1.1 TaxID=2496690 RepID=UPI000FCB31B6|nr:hypothetical protein [Mesorhizobium sp. M7A.F.Ca.CA.004.02.1.1]RVB02847.1 hypothetical protein EN912_10370 [Mesorhizobium sp. M7A.F.Ca.CA.004.02.1.1]